MRPGERQLRKYGMHVAFGAGVAGGRGRWLSASPALVPRERDRQTHPALEPPSPLLFVGWALFSPVQVLNPFLLYPPLWRKSHLQPLPSLNPQLCMWVPSAVSRLGTLPSQPDPCCPHQCLWPHF